MGDEKEFSHADSIRDQNIRNLSSSLDLIVKVFDEKLKDQKSCIDSLRFDYQIISDRISNIINLKNLFFYSYLSIGITFVIAMTALILFLIRHT